MEQEAYHILLKIALPYFQILHIYWHQYNNKKYEELEIPAQLNINADTLATAHFITSINTHILSTSAIYINTNI